MSKKKYRLLFAVVLPICFLVVFIFRKNIFALSMYSPKCLFYIVTGIYCPGCGDTRSCRALLNGNILLAMRNNMAIPFLGFVVLLFYVENLLFLMGKKIKLLTRKSFIWYGILILFGVYYVVRNFVPWLQPIN